MLRSDSAGRFKLAATQPGCGGHRFYRGERAGSSGHAARSPLALRRRADGSLHVLGHVGTGFSDEERRSLLSDCNDRLVASDYSEPSDHHVAYQMVRPELVVEIRIWMS